MKISFKSKIVTVVAFLLFLFWLWGALSPRHTGPSLVDESFSFERVASIAVRTSQSMGPTFIAVSKDQGRAYVLVPKRSCQESEQGPESLVAVIDLKKRQLEKAITTPRHILGAAISPDQKYLYLTNSYDDRVSILDLAANEIVKTLPAGPNPTANLEASCSGGFNYKPQFIAFSRDGKFAYTSNSKGNFIGVIDAEKQEYWGEIGVTNGLENAPRRILWGIAANPVRDELYVGVKSGNQILIIDTTTNQVAGSLTSAGKTVSPLGLAVDPSGDNLYLANSAAFAVTIFSTHTRSEIGEIKLPVGDAPNWITIDNEGKYAYVTTVQSNTVYALDLKKREIAGRLEGSGFPFMALGVGQEVYTTSIQGKSLDVYRRK